MILRMLLIHFQWYYVCYSFTIANSPRTLLYEIYYFLFLFRVHFQTELPNNFSKWCTLHSCKL